VLTPDERESFRGLTVDSEPTAGAKGRSYEYESRGGRHRVYIRHVTFGGKTGVWTKLAVLALVLLAVFVVLPLFFFALVALGAAWFILSLLRGR